MAVLSRLLIHPFFLAGLVLYTFPGVSPCLYHHHPRSGFASNLALPLGLSSCSGSGWDVQRLCIPSPNPSTSRYVSRGVRQYSCTCSAGRRDRDFSERDRLACLRRQMAPWFVSPTAMSDLRSWPPSRDFVSTSEPVELFQHAFSTYGDYIPSPNSLDFER
jgi:hypothetical protein